MNNQITGEEAKKAWANGENVWYTNGNSDSYSLNGTDFYSSIFNNPRYKFYLKPKSRSVNGEAISIPNKIVTDPVTGSVGLVYDDNSVVQTVKLQLERIFFIETEN